MPLLPKQSRYSRGEAGEAKGLTTKEAMQAAGLWVLLQRGNKGWG